MNVSFNLGDLPVEIQEQLRKLSVAEGRPVKDVARDLLCESIAGDATSPLAASPADEPTEPAAESKPETQP